MTSQRTSTQLTWHARPFRELVRLAWPIVTSLLSYSVMTLVDAGFVARLGASSIAATGLGGTAFFTVLCFGIGVFSGVKVRISEAVGANRRDQLPKMATAALRLALLLAFLLTGVAFGVAWLLPLASGPGETGVLARQYCAVRSLGMPAALIGCSIAQYRQALGDSRTAMRAALFANLVHIPLNALLIFGLGLGVLGAALATLACVWLEAGLLLFAQTRDGLVWSAADYADAWQLLRYSYPTGIERWLDVGAFAALVVLIARLGSTELAAHQICLQVLHFCFLPLVALSDAVCVLVAQSTGAGARAVGRRVIRHAFGLGTAFGSLCGMLLLLFGDAMVRSFTSDPEVITASNQVLRVGVALQFINVPFMVLKGALRGLGQLRYVASVSVLCAWLLTPPLTWLFGYRLGWGAAGGWAALTTELIVACVWFGARLWRTQRDEAAPHSTGQRKAPPAPSRTPRPV
jgi:multidrug resistance protein, MATE family